ncbi:MAG: hypothetical protein ACJAYU_000475 [Bradymonadia bacterium]|jgi:hypothetical protein
MNGTPSDLTSFWDYYVSEHADPTCRALHFAGTSLAFACVAGAAWQPWMLLLAPVVGYGFAWVGHLRFERNKPASWNSIRDLWWSFLCDMKMWSLVATGRMNAEVERVTSERSAAL